MTAFRGFIGPNLTAGSNLLSSYTTVVIDLNTKKWNVIFQAAKTGTLTSLGFRYSTKAGTPVAHQISLQGVDGSGFADGTVLGATNNAKAAFTPDGTWVAGTWKENGDGFIPALTENASVTQGERYCMVVEATGAASGTDSITISSVIAGFSGADHNAIPYHAFNGSKQNYVPLFSYNISGVSYRLGMPVIAGVSTAFSGDTGTFDEYGCAFKLPAFLPGGSTGKIDRFVPEIRMPVAAKTVKAILYQDTTPLQEVTLDSDQYRTTGIIGRVLTRLGGTPATLDAGTEYILAFQPQGTGEGMQMNAVQAVAAADLEGLGVENMHLVKRLNGGAWTHVNDTVPFFLIGYSDITLPSSGVGAADTTLQPGVQH